MNVAGYRLPTGFSHYDVWETVVDQLTQGVDPDGLRLGSEVRALADLWDGLEAFPAYGDESEPVPLAAAATASLGIPPDARGLVDHGSLGDEWERTRGRTSLISALLAQLSGTEGDGH